MKCSVQDKSTYVKSNTHKTTLLSMVWMYMVRVEKCAQGGHMLISGRGCFWEGKGMR